MFGVRSSASDQNAVLDSCEHGIDHLGSEKLKKFLTWRATVSFAKNALCS